MTAQPAQTALLTALPHLEWPVKDGSRVLTEDLTDQQLQQALDIGMARAARHFRQKGQACLIAQRDGTGEGYMADIRNAAYLQMARDKRALLKQMYTDPRFAAVICEAHGRIVRHHAMRKAATRPAAGA